MHAKAAFWALDLSIKYYRPLLSDLRLIKKQGKLCKAIFEILKIPAILYLLFSSFFACLELTESIYRHTKIIHVRPVGKGGSVGSDEPPSWGKGPQFHYVTPYNFTAKLNR